MIRVVLDTNVIVSGLLTSSGAEARTVDLAIARAIQAYVTPPILAEYEAVLSRPKFRCLGRKAIADALALLRRAAILIPPGPRLSVSPDEGDNRFLECAEAAAAHYLVTGNKRHFPAKWNSTLVLGAGELISILIDTESLPPPVRKPPARE